MSSQEALPTFTEVRRSYLAALGGAIGQLGPADGSTAAGVPCIPHMNMSHPCRGFGPTGSRCLRSSSSHSASTRDKTGTLDAADAFRSMWVDVSDTWKKVYF